MNENPYQSHFKALQAKEYVLGNSSASDRKKKIKALMRAVTETYAPDLRDALRKDLHKGKEESDLTEIYVVKKEAKHALKYLNQWMRPHRVPTPLTLLGSKSWTQAESKGVSLIISPWNFPVNLTFGPLVSALAAGNPVVLKPSEYTPETTAVMKKLITDTFPADEVLLIDGGVETSQSLLDLPFRHIFFTGSPRVGKIVMEAAAKNLSSVTLELGGKSPTIVDKSASIKRAAQRISWGKWMNAGQICIAPDYLYAHEDIADELCHEIQKCWQDFYPEGIASSESYGRLVSQKHADRQIDLLQDARDRGATIIQARGETKGTFIPPSLVKNCPLSAQLMQEEIFGPLLPLHTFKETQTVIDHIQEGHKPLSVYIYARDRKFTRDIIRQTRAGTTCINQSNIQFFNTHLPFGGSNYSGIGKSHGRYGFQEFTNQRAFLKQLMPSAADLLTPPFTRWKQKLINWTLRWL